MTQKNIKAQASSFLNIDLPARFIADLQKKSGDIPWHKKGKTDPWDLVESAMGLNIGGFFKEADLAFEWMIKKQNKDGSWFSSYINEKPKDKTRETNMSCYIATGVFHSWLIKKDKKFLEKMWEPVKKGIDFALSLQTKQGEIYWAKSPEKKVDSMALLTGCSSIYMSLKCAIAIGFVLKKKIKHWEAAFEKLGKSIQDNIHIYNISKSRFSMYWFYPVLVGALSYDGCNKRIEKYWKKYVIEGQGVRCVSDRPWITIAETCELVMALFAMGNEKLAKIVFSWIQDRIYEDGTFWCGYTFPDMTIWPEEKISWTNGVVLMACDMLYNLTSGSRLFCHNAWDGFIFKG